MPTTILRNCTGLQLRYIGEIADTQLFFREYPFVGVMAEVVRPGNSLGPGQEGTWSQRNYPTQGRNLVVFRRNFFEREAPRVKQVADATLYVVVMPGAVGTTAIIDEHTFMTTNLSAEFNPNAHVWRPRAAAATTPAADVIYRFDRHVDNTHGRGSTSGRITLEQTWAVSQSDSLRICNSHEIANKFSIPGLGDVPLAEFSAKVAAAIESARTSGATETSRMCEEHAFDVPAGANEIQQVFVRIGARGCTIVRTSVFPGC